MDVADRPIIGVVDRNDTSRLVELIMWQLCFLVLFQKLALVQISSVVVSLSHSQNSVSVLESRYFLTRQRRMTHTAR